MSCLGNWNWFPTMTVWKWKWSHSVVSNSLQPHGLLQARILEWVAISFSRGSSRPRDWTQVSRIAGRRFNLWATRVVQLLSCVQIFVTPWTTAHQAFLSFTISRSLLKLRSIELVIPSPSHPLLASFPPFNFMAEVTIHSDFGAWENKVCHCFHCFHQHAPCPEYQVFLYDDCVYVLSCVWLLGNPWIVARQAPLSMASPG